MRNKIFNITSFLAAVLLLSSCLKDDVGEDWTDSLKGKMYAEVWRPGFLATGLAPVADPVIFKFLVNIATDELPTSDITLSIAVNDDARLKYNAAKGTSYQLYPYIEILNPTVVIKAGTRNAYVHVKVWNADLLDACDNFMAPISIVDADGGVVVSDAMNNGSRLMALPISNPYAATYSTVGYRIRPGNPTEPIVADEEFSTVDCKTVDKAGFGNYSVFSINIEITADPIVVGGVTCFKVIATPYDPATGAEVGGMFDTWTGDAATAPAPPADPTWINYYNPVTKQFVLNCYYNSAAGNRIMYEVHTRI
jgi:hypothetical protein